MSKKKPSLYHGLLLLDKPEGQSSHDLVRRVRKHLHMSAVGHCGTLDPMASGLMVILLGEATKLSQYILEQEKAYDLSLEWGYETDTLDATGSVVAKTDERPPVEAARQAALALQGDLELPVPAYSAVKVDGQRLYKQARRGEEPVQETPRRIMSFFALTEKELSRDGGSWAIQCSKGSYIRSWVKELGDQVGVGATLTALRRTASFPFTLSQALSLENFEALSDLNGHDSFISMDRALPHLKCVHVAGLDQKLLVNGQISHRLRQELITRYQVGAEAAEKQAIRVMSLETGQMVALVGVEKQKGFVIRRVFNH